VYYGSYICNDISCLVRFFCCIFHLLVIFLPLYLIKWRTSEEEWKHVPMPTSRCCYHHHHIKWAIWRKQDITLLSFATLCLLLSHLAHSNEDRTTKKVVSVAFMPMHLGASWVLKVSKMHLGVVQIFWEFSGLFWNLFSFSFELFLFIRRL
jgi:hypothetical protein